MIKKTINYIFLCLLIDFFFAENLNGQIPYESSVDSAMQFLRQTYDRFHNSFDVYTDQDAAGNHFAPTGWMSDSSPENQLEYFGDWLDNTHSGNTCIKVNTTFQTGGANWAGIYWQYPNNNWGTVKKAGYDLTGCKGLEFFVKGKKGGEKVEFFAFGIKGKYGDSETRYPPSGAVMLDTTWTKYIINLSGKKLNYVIGGFAFLVDKSKNNGQDITFYLDDIRYILNNDSLEARQRIPHFPVSYEVSFDKNEYNEDRSIRNTAYTEYSALAMLAFMSDTTDIHSRDWQRAEQIGDAFVTAMFNDRYFNEANDLFDGRLRNAYMAGDLLDHFTGFTKIPGWWDTDLKNFNEVEYAAGSSTGSMAWVIFSLMQFCRYKYNQSYVDAAIQLGNWIRGRFDNEGYCAGFQGLDSVQVEMKSKSVEHNIMVYAAYIKLAEITGTKKWQEYAKDARNYVKNQWDGQNQHFYLPYTNIHALAYLFVDTSFVQGMDWAQNNTYVNLTRPGYSLNGFDYNDDRDGIWFEGTAQMALAFKKKGDVSKYRTYFNAIKTTQFNEHNSDGKGIVESDHDSLSTGLLDPQGQELFKMNRLHIGSTAWFILANNSYVTSVMNDKKIKLAEDFRLEQNCPNPFNQSTSIQFEIPIASNIRIKLYDILGHQILTLTDKNFIPGKYTIKWNGNDTKGRAISSGIYFIRMETERITREIKILLLK